MARARNEREAIAAEAEALRGKRTGVRYPDLARCLGRAGCDEVGRSGSHRTWRHPRVAEHLTLRDSGSGEVLPVYVMKTRKYLLGILETL